MSIKIYHNPRCSKSRKALDMIKKRITHFEIVEYLKKPLKINEIKLLLSLLKIKPIELVRIKELVWKENYKNKKLNDNDIINAIVHHPKLMQRPIITNKNKAIIGRNLEKVLDIIN
ncbi:MAG: arsenate reductase (glutaredoxin) [Flavobacteriales bacterium]|nr:arsenate reductase (glutaredoxin) [Flavobacteriales bacterium]MAU36425.1 arsenate reductase (glutaredoxin) [Flavobacteriales bacterium]|tara:strand:+ start:9711 stop:10058 length:348 start_codon:yes stop_codon:yes gene_type:complete